MKVRVKTFDEFWGWLEDGPQVVPNLGCRQGRRFSIEVDMGRVTCMPRSTKKMHSIGRNSVERVWERYHRLLSSKNASGVHLRAGSYALSNKKPSKNSWPDCPNKTCAPWIAAAIAFFLDEHPCPMASQKIKTKSKS